MEAQICPCGTWGLSTETRKWKHFMDLHPTPTGVDGGRKTPPNARTYDLYTPVWLG
ncbi:hypothetical protein [Spirosoma montaniterrae]|uniref:hypothetical protein n=1 Tax=Spirosoma montaniterrae TaxID=1178516 RepID=UPI0012FB464C|nr:hypothetical protein [Spirosoma montaniterrae]